MSAKSEIWLTVEGKGAGALAEELKAKVSRDMTEGRYTDHEMKRIAKLDMALAKGELNLDDDQVRKLRRLCQLWDVDLRPLRITSHRPYLGPIIVFAKKIVFSILKVLLRDFIHQQREFNAVAISTLADALVTAKKNK